MVICRARMTDHTTLFYEPRCSCNEGWRMATAHGCWLAAAPCSSKSQPIQARSGICPCVHTHTHTHTHLATHCVRMNLHAHECMCLCCVLNRRAHSEQVGERSVHRHDAFWQGTESTPLLRFMHVHTKPARGVQRARPCAHSEFLSGTDD